MVLVFFFVIFNGFLVHVEDLTVSIFSSLNHKKEGSISFPLREQLQLHYVQQTQTLIQSYRKKGQNK